MQFRLNLNSNFTKMIIIAELFIVSYLLYVLTLSVYKSYEIDQYILNFKKENEQYATRNKQLEQDLWYYSSDAYFEKYAKENMGKSIPGEEVIVISSNALDTTTDAGSQNKGEKSGRIQTLSNPQKWWKFFFDFEKDTT